VVGEEDEAERALGGDVQDGVQHDWEGVAGGGASVERPAPSH
jgi:hypothetical protein